MSRIRIVNWLLTRRCNLKCDYCAIVKNYEGKPDEYPDMSHYIKNEMTTSDVIAGLTRIKEHNPDAFHIFYGGEPILRKDLATIINFCNREDIHYTIISNNTIELLPMITQLIEDVEGKIKGFTASIDPIFFDEEGSEDSVRKSLQGFASLNGLKRSIEDVVAEITVMKHNQQYIHQLIRMLTDNGINSDLTFVDIAKNPYYDFSNVTDPDLLVRNTAQLAEQFQKIHDDKLDVHMMDVLLPAIWDILPSNMDCENWKGVHNITVDADGTIRLCLRIRGVQTPTYFNLENIIDETNNVHTEVNQRMYEDTKAYCRLCNHTCQLMSKYIDRNDLSPDDLVHLDRRK